MKKTSMISRVLLCAAAAMAAVVPLSLKATPYASEVTNNAGTIQFFLNESNATVVVTYEDGTTNANFDGITTGTGVAAGLQSFALGAHSSYAITVSKLGSGSPSLIKSLSISGTQNPRGIDVNKNAKSPYFGRVYEVNGGGSPSGVWAIHPDLSYVFTNVARNGGITTFGSPGTGPGQSPYRISVAADDTLIVGDATTAGAAVYQLDPNITTNPANHLLLGPVGLTNSGVPVTSHGTIESRPLLIGSTNGGNAVLYLIDGELSPFNSLQIYNIGSGPLPWTTPPTTTGPQIGIGYDSIFLGGNEYPGLTRGPNGYFYCSTFRSDLSRPLVQVYAADAATLLWNSWQPDGTAYPGGTPTGDYFLVPLQTVTEGVTDSAVSADGKYLVAVNNHNGAIICPLTNGIPNPAGLFTVSNPAGTSSGTRGVTWDAALNFYLSCSGLGVVQEWSLGVTATAVTQGDATGQTNFAITLPSTQVSATATTPFASQTGPTPGVFTITRSSVVAADTNSAQTIFFTLTGTATNGTAFLSTNITSSVNKGINYTNIAITSTPATNGVYSISGELFTNGTTYATNTFTVTNGAVITTNVVATARTTFTATLSVVFAPGQTSTNIIITPVVDGLSRPTTTVILTLLGSGNYTIVSPSSGTVTIENTGPEAVFISRVVGASMYKGLTNDFGSFVLTRYGDTNNGGNAITVANYTYAGTATAGEYVPAGSVTLNPGDVSVTNIITPLIDTPNYVGNKTVIVSLAAGSGYVIYSNNPVTLTIIDNANLPATVLWTDPLTDPNDATHWNVNSANDNMASAGIDNTIEFGYDLTVNNPEGNNYGYIPLPPSGATTCLRVSVNKNGGAAGGVNLYPANVTFSGDYAVRFSMDIAEGNNANYTTEGPLFGINHTGMFTNWWSGSGIASGWDPANTSSNWTSDGVWYWVCADGGANPGDFLEKTGLGFTNNNTGWTNIASASRTSYVNIFKDPMPYSTLNGTAHASGLPANSSPYNAYSSAAGYTNAWADVEIKTVKNLVTMSINKTAIFIYTNTTVWTNGTLMLGYNDPFNSIGGVDAAVYFSNIRVVRLAAPTFTLQPTNLVVGLGGNASFAAAIAFDSSSVNTNGQWSLNGTAIAGATNYVYTFTVKTNSYGTYTFAVNDGNYTVTSSNAVLTAPTPTIASVLPATRAAVLGGAASFAVTANTFSGTTNYQWLSNSVPIASATSRTLTITNVVAGNFGSIYSVRVNDGMTSVTSAPPVTLTSAVSQLITAPGLTSGKFSLTFSTESGPSYVIDSKTNLLQANWLPVSTNAGTGGIISVTNAVSSSSQGYYRLRLQ